MGEEIHTRNTRLIALKWKERREREGRKREGEKKEKRKKGFKTNWIERRNLRLSMRHCVSDRHHLHIYKHRVYACMRQYSHRVI